MWVENFSLLYFCGRYEPDQSRPLPTSCHLAHDWSNYACDHGSPGWHYQTYRVRVIYN